MTEQRIISQINKFFVGDWYCEILNLSLKISERNRGISYWFEYDHPPFPDSSITKEIVELRYVDKFSPLAHIISETWRLPMLRFIDKNTFQLIKEHPETKEAKTIIFKRNGDENSSET